MATATRHLCRSLVQVARVTPAKRKCLIAPLRMQPAGARPYTASSSRRADPPASHAPTQATSETKQDEQEQEQDEAKYLDFDKNDRLHQNFLRQYVKDDNDAEFDLSSAFPEDDTYQPPVPEMSERLTPAEPQTTSTIREILSDQKKSDYDALSTAEKEEFVSVHNHFLALAHQFAADPSSDPDALDQTELVPDHEVNQLDRELALNHPLDLPNPRARPKDLGWWGEDEDDEFGMVEDDDDDYDESMISTVAENQLDLHRDIREYMRVTMWEMPLLAKFAKPFHQPAASQPLRFRYTTHMGESHPSSRKVVVEFCTSDLTHQQNASLTEQQRIKLIKLLGPRYNPESDIARIGSEKFEHPAQNKRYLGDLVDNLIKEAKDPKDMFEDIPLDFRHHLARVSRRRARHEFPEEWNITKQRVAEIAVARGLNEQPRLEAGEISRLTEEQKESQQRVASYVHAMPLGRREMPRTGPAEEPR